MKFGVAYLCISLSSLAAGEVETLRMEPAAHMVRADLQFIKMMPAPQAVLILCPGYNGDGAGLIQSPDWQEFATRYDLGLVGLSFASPPEALSDGTGYYYASVESGQKLIEGIRRIYGKDLPLLLYGFSGGAHFTSRFEEWKPERVVAWCAFSAGWWDVPKKALISPPGIVACGDSDARYGATLIYFKQGRAAGKPWLWVSLFHTGHEGSPNLDEFVRKYFSTILGKQKKNPEFVDIDQKTIVSAGEGQVPPSLTGWLPAEELFTPWNQIHSP